MNSVLLLSTTTILAFLIGAPGVTGSGGKRGDPCKRDPDCDQESLIGCDRNTGKCACPTHFPLFYSSEGTCVSFVHGVCTYVKSPPLPPISCIENAVCVKSRDPREVNGMCECKKGYEKTIGNACAVSSARGGIETPRSKGGAASTRNYPEPYHSMSSASKQFSRFNLLQFFGLLILAFHLHVH